MDVLWTSNCFIAREVSIPSVSRCWRHYLLVKLDAKGVAFDDSKPDYNTIWYKVDEFESNLNSTRYHCNGSWNIDFCGCYSILCKVMDVLLSKNQSRGCTCNSFENMWTFWLHCASWWYITMEKMMVLCKDKRKQQKIFSMVKSVAQTNF